MKITGPTGFNGIKLSPELEKALEASKPQKKTETDFSKFLSEEIDKVDELQKSADVAANDFATGKTKDIHEAVLAMEMADTSLKLAVTVRNKVIDAYQEVMRMPI